MSHDWQPGRRWRIIDPITGELWMESSDEDEARREHVKTGYLLERLWVRSTTQWRPDEPSSMTSPVDR